MRRIVLGLVIAVATMPAVRARSDGNGAIGDVVMGVPADECLAASTAKRLVNSARHPAGIEFVAGACPGPRTRTFRKTVSFEGMDLDEALDELVRLAPAYEWREDAGVVLVRPVAAWNDPDHFLTTHREDFALEDASLEQGLGALRTLIGPLRYGSEGLLAETPDAGRRITVALSNPTALDAADAIVRAHGAAVWEVSYCRPPAGLDSARFAVETFDGARVESHAVVRRDERGRPFDPCARR